MTAFFSALSHALIGVSATDKNRCRLMHDARADAFRLLDHASFASNGKGRLIFIGNGGSAAIASHMANDWQKNGGYRTLCFNDAASLTCLGNDLGYDEVFAHPISLHIEKDDVLFAISSSGRSRNILNAADAAKQRQASVLTFSGFDHDNPLRTMGDLNFHVPSSDYGIVECAHLALIHSLLNEAIDHA